MSDLIGCETCPAPTTQTPDGGSSTNRSGDKLFQGGRSDIYGKTFPEYVALPIVFNLCSQVDSGGLAQKVVEEYSGYSGFHIRTIPGRRWRNPISITAGNQCLVVLDRFEGLDVLRITDKYGGAGPGGFDSDGNPLGSVNWPELADLETVSIPSGYQTTGFTFTERGTILASLVGGTDPTFYKKQIGDSHPNLNGIFSLEGGWGELIGNPIGLYGRPGEQVYQALSLVKRDNSSAVILYDWREERILGCQGLPDDWEPIALSEANNVINVLMRNSDETTQIVRFPYNYKTGFMSGGNHADKLEKPETYDITTTFPGAISIHSELQSIGNKDRGQIAHYPNPDHDISGGGRKIEATNTFLKSDSRVQEFQEYKTTYYGETKTLRGNIIANPDTRTIQALCSGFGTTCETLQSLAEGEVDPEQPVFRLIDAVPYSYVSDGGFVYGCAFDTVEDSVDVGVTSGFTPGSIAIDVGYERGKLKSLPDLKVALLDVYTGLYIWQPVKPLKNNFGGHYRIYAGDYAGLDKAEGSTIKSSPCTTQMDVIATKIDGIKRPGHVTPGEDPEPEQFDIDTTDLDAPWNLYIRRAILGTKPDLSPKVQSFSTHDPSDGAFYPEHRNPQNICRVSGTHDVLWPKRVSNVPDPTFIYNVRSGFFVPNYEKERSTNHDVLREQIAELEAQIADLQAAIDGGTLTPAEEEVKQGQIASLNTQIENLQNQIATTEEEVIFRVKPSVLNVRYPAVEGTYPQLLTDPDETGDFDQSSAVEIPTLSASGAWTVGGLDGRRVNDSEGETFPIRRKATMNTNIRSWVAVDIVLDREGVISDGVVNYRNQEYHNNGVGRLVPTTNPGTTDDASCHRPGNVYEAGYRARDGAIGRWEIDILANGVPITQIATRVTFMEQLQYLAPLDAQQVLTNTLLAAGGVNPIYGYHKGKVFFSPEVIDEVTVRVRLVNDAYGVYRVGYRTWNRSDSPGYFAGDGVFCPGRDPGFFTGAACESCCGNVTCPSFIFFGNQLQQGDTITARTRQILWEGEATYRVTDDPYRDTLNVGMGRVIDAYFDFNLNTTMISYNVDISQDQ